MRTSVVLAVAVELVNVAADGRSSTGKARLSAIGDDRGGDTSAISRGGFGAGCRLRRLGRLVSLCRL